MCTVASPPSSGVQEGYKGVGWTPWGCQMVIKPKKFRFLKDRKFRFFKALDWREGYEGVGWWGFSGLRHTRGINGFMA